MQKYTAPVFQIMVIVFVVFLSSTTCVSAAPILTELHPAPATGQPEWIELHNPDSESYDLTGWQLWDELSSPSLILTLSITMAPGQTTTIDLPSAKLNNSADGVTLRSPTGQIVDEFNYTSSEPSKSWVRSGATWQLGEPNPGVYLAETPRPSPTPAPSPSPLPTPSPTPVPTPTPTPLPSIKLTELYPCPPTGETEYIKIQNTGSTAIDLTQIQIKDEQQNLRTSTGTLAPGATTTITWQTAMLNNTGDTVSVFAATKLLDSAQYANCASGQPLILKNNTWQTEASDDDSVEVEETLPAATIQASPSPTPTTAITPTPTAKSRQTNHHSLPILSLQSASNSPLTSPPPSQPRNTLTYTHRNTPRSAIGSAILGSALLLSGGATLLAQKPP